LKEQTDVNQVKYYVFLDDVLGRPCLILHFPCSRQFKIWLAFAYVYQRHTSRWNVRSFDGRKPRLPDLLSTNYTLTTFRSGQM